MFRRTTISTGRKATGRSNGPALYLVASKCQLPRFDVATSQKFEVHTDLDRAIDRARKIYFHHVDGSFRGGINSHVKVIGAEEKAKLLAYRKKHGYLPDSYYDRYDKTGVAEFPCSFSLENLEHISEASLAQVWAQSDDCHYDCYGGVARVEVIKMNPFDLGKQQDKKEKKKFGMEYHHHEKRSDSVVFRLPLREKEFDEVASLSVVEEQKKGDGKQTRETTKVQQSRIVRSRTELSKPTVEKEQMRIKQREERADSLQAKGPIMPSEAKPTRGISWF